MCKKKSGTEADQCKIALQSNVLKCTTHNSTDICGKLYNQYTSNPFNENLKTQAYSDYLHEPGFLTNYDNDKTYNNGLFDLNSLQREFNEMAVSVAKYGGFWVGRYEMSLSNSTSEIQATSGTAQSKKNVKSATENNSGTYKWYGLYAKAKTYSGTAGSVKSNMIWGSQYDAMMLWMLGNGVNVKNSQPVDITGVQTKRNTSSQLVTGNQERDKICNIYDLTGCCGENTMEAFREVARINRTSNYNNFTNGAAPVNRGENRMSSAASAFIGVRIALYL